MGSTDFSLDPEWDYVRSDYLSTQEQETEADVPVPDRLLPKVKLHLMVSGLKRSQRLGLLCWLASVGLLTLGGRERLLKLQISASYEALAAAEKFAQRLHQEGKLQRDFLPVMRELNRRPRQTATYRRMEKRRIGVGYRDKGTLPVASSRERTAAVRDSYVPLEGFPEYTQRALQSILPFSLTEDGFVDLQIVTQALAQPWVQPEVWTLSS